MSLLFLAVLIGVIGIAVLLIGVGLGKLLLIIQRIHSHGFYRPLNIGFIELMTVYLRHSDQMMLYLRQPKQMILYLRHQDMPFTLTVVGELLMIVATVMVIIAIGLRTLS
jgi:hypothetical protein